MSIYQDIFEDLGLSPNEAKIYEALLEYGEMPIGEISIRAGVHRRNTYDAIERLIQKGLCFSIVSSSENRYQAVDPDKLLEFIAERREKLERILPDLKGKFEGKRVPEESYIYKGLEGQKNIWRDVLRVGKDNYFIGAKKTWFDPRLESSRKAFFKEANRIGIKFKHVFDQDVQKDLEFIKNFPGNLEFRFFPGRYSTDSAIQIFGDYIVTYSGLSLGKIDEKVVFFVMHSKNLSDSYRAWFSYIWDNAEKATH